MYSLSVCVCVYVKRTHKPSGVLDVSADLVVDKDVAVLEDEHSLKDNNK